MNQSFSFGKSILIGAILFFGITVMLLFSRLQFDIDPTSPQSFPTHAMKGGAIWKLELAVTPEEQSLGLGKRESQPAYHGLLFVFPKPARYGFWMKDMRFPIDIIFLKEGKIVEIERSFHPNDSRVVMPSFPIDEVLEVNAGEAEHLSPGNRLWYWRSF